ncbi:conjugative transposon protein TraK [Runella limosa]|uniref:conjugative transposon protein TraK n=1 Tax=Runella limosa TaxID=370978 RepID=UPI00048F6E4A|nr:conjugative transposon protein TraK [Runella limosa]
MEELLKLEKHYNRVKILTIVCLVSLGIISIFSLILSQSTIKEMTKRIFIIDKGAQFEAIAGVVTENRPVEIGYHVRRFHELFFSLSPDADEIEATTNKSFFLADESAKKLYEDLKEQGFYTSVIQGNVIQKIVIDSVVINTQMYPYGALTYATVKQTRASSKGEKKLITRCNLEDMPRSVNSPNGLMIRDFRILESKVYTSGKSLQKDAN